MQLRPAIRAQPLVPLVLRHSTRPTCPFSCPQDGTYDLSAAPPFGLVRAAASGRCILLCSSVWRRAKRPIEH